VCRNMQAEAERHPTVESAREEWHRLQTFGAATAYMRALEAEVERLKKENELLGSTFKWHQTQREAAWARVKQAEAELATLIDTFENGLLLHMDRPVIRGLRERAEQAEAELAKLNAEANQWTVDWCDAQKHIAELEAELAALRDTFLQTDEDEALWRKLQQAETDRDAFEKAAKHHCRIALDNAREIDRLEAELAALKARETGWSGDSEGWVPLVPKGELDAAQAELTALKAWRCETCALKNDCQLRRMFGSFKMAIAEDFACNRWAAREEG